MMIQLAIVEGVTQAHTAFDVWVLGFVPGLLLGGGLAALAAGNRQERE